MNRIIRRIANDFNIKKEAEELGVSVWRTPSVLFILMGFVAAVSIMFVFYFSRNQVSPETLFLGELLVVAIIFSIGGFIIKSVEEVARANKMKSEFISIVSHQMRTPLTEINWETEYFLSEYKDRLDENQIKIIKTIVRSNAKLSNLINDLLDAVKIEQSRLVLAGDKVLISKIIDEAVEDKKETAESNSIKIETEISSFLPEIIIDKRRISSVINGLVSNAIVYAKRGGSVKISAGSDGKNIIVNVKDDGVGIPERQQKNIFEKFFRSGNKNRYRTEGNGLSLYIAKKVIEKAGGKIWFKSTEGEGSVFSFSLPISD